MFALDTMNDFTITADIRAIFNVFVIGAGCSNVQSIRRV